MLQKNMLQTQRERFPYTSAPLNNYLDLLNKNNITEICRVIFK